MSARQGRGGAPAGDSLRNNPEPLSAELMLALLAHEPRRRTCVPARVGGPQVRRRGSSRCNRF